MKNTKGFTLIELLIVIGIIAILASGVIVAINPGRQFEQARNSTRWQHMNTVANAFYSYAVENTGNFPSCVDGTRRDLNDCRDALVTTGEYLNDLPEDPSAGGADYTYDGVTCSATADCTGYIISTDGTTITIEAADDEANQVGNEVTLTK
jgi:type IV pilus assembly protein PilA